MSAASNLQINQNGAPSAATTGRNPKARTLREPPEIWELVRETRADFKPGSVLVGHLKAIRPLGLIVILTVIGSVAVFSFMTLSGRSAATPASPAQAESGNIKTEANPQSTSPTGSESSSPSTNDASNITAASTIDEAKTTVATQAASAKTVNGTTADPNTVVVPPSTSSGNQAPAKPRTQQPTISTTAIGETVAARNKDRIQASKMSRVNVPTAPRTDMNDVGTASITPGPKIEKVQAANPPAAKKEADKAVSTKLIAPAKTISTPKAKVIAWP